MLSLVFNTQIASSITFGNEIYNEDGTIMLPVNGVPLSNTTYISKTDFRVDATHDINYFLFGSLGSYNLIFTPPEDAIGTIRVTPSGSLLTQYMKQSLTGIASNSISYDTSIPEITDSDIPELIEVGIWDVYIEFNRNVISLNYYSFTEDGVDLGNPTLYSSSVSFKSPGGKASTADEDAFITGTTDLVSMTGNWQIVPETGNTVASKYFLLRYIVDTADTGAFTLSLRESQVVPG